MSDQVTILSDLRKKLVGYDSTYWPASGTLGFSPQKYLTFSTKMLKKWLVKEFCIFQMGQQLFWPGQYVRRHMRFGQTKVKFGQTLSDDRLLFAALDI